MSPRNLLAALAPCLLLPAAALCRAAPPGDALSSIPAPADSVFASDSLLIRTAGPDSLLMLFPPADSLPALPDGASWRLVWHDEFEGAALDTSKWTRLGDWKRRDGYWSKREAYLDGDGFLVLRTRRAGAGVMSGALTTSGKFERAFGYYVVRCKMPSQPGHWPAFWLTCPGASAPGGDGRAGTEIDVVEMPWRDGRVASAAHWSGYGKAARSSVQVLSIPTTTAGFHTFGLLWTAGGYVFTADGREVWRTGAGGVSRVAEYINLTDEVGAWAGDIAKAALPDAFLVDYVRVYAEVQRGRPPE